ncbi:efflux RND transporter periplasmic adaptor subunit [Verticiella alkaliphila]|uniref:efflux RND transporter periplasmic adaptor subunit n=1 Tax=Verticiella alkaliphila TaxID=2779529 RepID=UPI00209A74EA|nr:efflux RND transporter periplasmic adaptor subunit [Verticiella sp. GG226]
MRRHALALALSALLTSAGYTGAVQAGPGHAETAPTASAAPASEDHEEASNEIHLSAAQRAAAKIEISTAQPGRMAQTSRFPGEIAFNADRTAHVVPRLAGVVQQVTADLGQSVKKGQVLATLSSVELSELRATWASAVKQRDLEAANYRREESLWREQVSARQDLEQARATLAQAQITAQNAEQKLRAVGASPQARDFSVLEVRAPFDGVVVEKHIALGEALTEASNIFTISDLSTVWAEFVIAPGDLAKVRVGENARVSAVSFDDSVAGKVSYIGSLLGQQTRTATARITLQNPDLAWRPGLFVNVDVVTDETQAPIVVRSSAIQTLGEESVVFVETEDGFRVQPVKLGRTAEDITEILEGLDSGTRYAATNAFTLKSELGKASADHAH